MNKFSTFFIIYLIVTNVVLLVNSNTLKNKKSNLNLNVNKSRSNMKNKAYSSSSTSSSSASTGNSSTFKKAKAYSFNTESTQSYLKKNKSKTKQNGEINLEIWEKCANEGEICWFSGTTIVRYGALGSYYYTEATNYFYCNNNSLGDPRSGIYKHCHIKKNRYEWKHCSGENGRCNFGGTLAVKYGADSRWSFRTGSNGIDCNNGTFGDPAF